MESIKIYTMPDKDKKNQRLKELGLTPKDNKPKPTKHKLDRETRQDIRRRAKKESGSYGSKGRKIDEKYQKDTSKGKKDYSETGVGKAIRKVTGKRKLVGGGADLGSKRRKKREERIAGAQSARFESKKGETARSKTYTAKSEKGLIKAGEKANKEIGAAKPTNVGDVGRKTFAKGTGSYNESKKSKPGKSERTEDQLKYDEEILDRRRTYKRKYGEGKGKRKLKRDLKKEYKEQARSGKYQRNR